jgi:hypothetical protein
VNWRGFKSGFSTEVIRFRRATGSIGEKVLSQTLNVGPFIHAKSRAAHVSHPWRLMPELSSRDVFSDHAIRGVLWAMPRRPRASSKIMPPCPLTRACR